MSPGWYLARLLIDIQALAQMPQRKASAKKPSTRKPKSSTSKTSRGIGIDSAIRLTAAEKRRMDNEAAMYQAQEDLRILRASREIMSDSSRMKRAQALIDEEVRALQSVKPKRSA